MSMKEGNLSLCAFVCFHGIENGLEERIVLDVDMSLIFLGFDLLGDEWMDFFLTICGNSI